MDNLHVDVLLMEDAALLRDHLGTKILDINVIKSLVKKARIESGLPEAQATIAVVAVDPRGRTEPFVQMLKKQNVEVISVPFFWANTVYLELASPEQLPLPRRHGATASYILGMLAGRAETSGKTSTCVVFGSDFSLAVPALDFQSRKQLFLLMFPRSLVDKRWITEVGLCPIGKAPMYQTGGVSVPFWDMTDHMSTFLGEEYKKADAGPVTVTVPI